jgi:Tol biopolymer transport system component
MRQRLMGGAAVAVVAIGAVIVISGNSDQNISGFSAPSARAAFLSKAPVFSASDACGAVKNWANAGAGGTGFPVVNTTNCQAHLAPAQAAPVGWKSIVTSKTVCEDWVIYHTNRTGNWELFRSGTDNKPESDINLSRSMGSNGADGDNVEPSLSPDRKWVAFASNRDGAWGIYTASTDGTKLQRVTDSSFSINVSPAWAPDGHALVYESARSGSWNLFVFDVKSGQESVLTDTSAGDIDPYWSPDSQHIVFESQRSGSWQIYVIDMATQQVTMVTDGQGNDYNPMYSPDGKQILYRAFRPGNESHSILYVMNADGSKARPITDPDHNATNQVWSPDGTLIAYQSDKNSVADIYVYQVTTDKTRQVTASVASAEHYAPTWRCDGKTIIFTSDISGTPNLYSAAALPIDAPPIDVKAKAIALTSLSTSSAQFPVSSPGQVEEASRLKLLPAITNQDPSGNSQTQ